jgi:hypothetical protein
LEIGVATAEKQRAVTLAEIEKQYRLNRLIEEGTNSLVRHSWGWGWPYYAWGFFAGYWGDPWGYYDLYAFGSRYYDHAPTPGQAAQTRKTALADEALDYT